MSVYEFMVPSPKYVRETPEFNFHGLTIDGYFKKEIRVFKAYIKKALNLKLTRGGDIKVVRDLTVDAGEYLLITNKNGITIRASECYGAGYGLASLLQIIQNVDGKILCRDVEIRDRADFDYRGTMIDCARNVHPLANLKSYIDMCWLYKLKYLHLHFTDDEAYTLPSKLFPKLTSEHNHYTDEEIKELVEYAYERNVQIVPEIDTPGHSTIIRNKYPEIFGDNKIIDFSPKAIEAMQSLYRELCEMFPHSEYIHIGADESHIMSWNDSEDCIKYGESLGVHMNEFPEHFLPYWHRSELFLVHYINKMAEAIVAEGRKPLVWEGFSRDVNDSVTRDVTVMVFESLYQPAVSLINNGFKVINCSWRPTYIVTPDFFWGREECFKWSVGSFAAVHPHSPYNGGVFKLDNTNGLQGGQLNSWGDCLARLGENGLEDEYQKITEDAPCIAEHTWNSHTHNDYMGFLECDRHCAAILSKIRGKK